MKKENVFIRYKERREGIKRVLKVELGTESAELLVPGLGIGTLVQRMKTSGVSSLCVVVKITLDREVDLTASVRALSGTEVADRLLGASVGSIAGRKTVGRLAAEGPVVLEGSGVGLKGTGHVVPPASAQRLVGGDGDVSAIGFSCAVLKVPVRRRACRIPCRGLVHIGNVSLRVEHVPALGVDLVNTETRVNVGVRGDGGSDPGSRDGVLGILGTGSIGDSKLVVMGVSKELLSNNVGGIALNNLVVEGRPVLETISLRGSDVTNDPNTLSGILSSLELGNEPLEFSHRIVVLSIGVQVKVQGVTKVVVHRNDAEARGRTDGVGTVALDSFDSVSGQPARPVISQAVV